MLFCYLPLQAADLDPSNAAVKKELLALKQKEQKRKEAERKAFSKLFG